MADPTQLVPYIKASYSSIVVYNVAVNLCKISILLQYRRIFSSNNGMRIATTIGLLFVGAWGIALTIILILTCIPVHALWDKSIQGARCFARSPLWYIRAGVHLATDFVILLMPMPLLGSLRLPTQQKFMLIGIFGLGLL